MYISAQELAFALSARSDNSSMDGKDGLASSLGVATHHVCGLCGAERTSSYEFHRNMFEALLSCYAVDYFHFKVQAVITQSQPFNGQDVAPHRKRKHVRANPRRSRNRPTSSPASDGLSLREREEEAFTMLRECKVSVKTLTMKQAVDRHLASTDKKFRIALRVAIAFVRLRGPRQEDMVNQLDQFYFDVTACVSALDLEGQEASDLRSVFLLAGNHRADPTRGLGEKLWAARLS
jgi:hypothetical protein